MSRIGRIILLFAIAWAHSPLAYACTAVCFPAPDTVEKAYRKATLVLIGTVREVEERVWADIEVKELYKGKAEPTLRVEHGYGPECRMSLLSGETYLIFFYGEKRNGLPVPDYQCAPSGELSKVSEAVTWVRKQKSRPLSSPKEMDGAVEQRDAADGRRR